MPSPYLCECFHPTRSCVSPNFRPETTFSRVAGGRVRTADPQTRRLALNPLLHGELTILWLIWFCWHKYRGYAIECKLLISDPKSYRCNLDALTLVHTYHISFRLWSKLEHDIRCNHLSNLIYRIQSTGMHCKYVQGNYSEITFKKL